MPIPTKLFRLLNSVPLIALVAHFTIGPLAAATITVNTVSEPGSAPDGLCSLRQAIASANSNAAADPDCAAGDQAPTQDVIAFSIPGSGPHILLPSTPLPFITEPLQINGYSQPGATENTLAIGTDAILLIEINAANVPLSIGLDIRSSNTEIRGLAFNGNFARGIQTQQATEDVIVAGNYFGTDTTGLAGTQIIGAAQLAGSNGLFGGISPADRNVVANGSFIGIGLSATGLNNMVLGNYIGVDASGSTALPNDTGILDEGTNTIIGSAVAPNIISGNSGSGIQMAGGSGAVIAGNFIGTDPLGIVPLPNQTGIEYFSGSSEAPTLSLVGGEGQGNLIAHSSSFGIRVGDSNFIPRGHRFSANSIFNNGTLGIDLTGLVGVDEAAGSDPLDADDGPNRLQNRPVLIAAVSDGSWIQIQWSLGSTPSSEYSVEFFHNSSCDPSGSGEGETFLGAFNAFTDINGFVETNSGFMLSESTGSITATATDLNTNDTSEFSACAELEIDAPQEIPTGSAWGLALLVVVLSGTAMRLIQRN